MKKGFKVFGILACMILLVGSGAMAQVGVFENTVTLDAANDTTAVPGSITLDGGTYTIQGNGADIWGTGDEAFFAYTELAGSNTITAKVKWIQAKGDAAGGSDWAKIGVMVRDAAEDPASAHYWIELRCGAGDPALGDQTDAQWRPTAGSSSSNVEVLQTDGSKLASPDGVWLRVTRNAATNEMTSEFSMDGKNWNFGDTQTIEMSETAAYGLIITSHTNDDQIVIAEASDVAITQSNVGVFDHTVTLDAENSTTAEIGSISLIGDTYTIQGNGADIWGTGDEAFFAYTELAGSNTISAKVKWIQTKGDAAGGSDWAKIGVMVRDTATDPGSTHYWIEMRGGAGDPATGDQTDAQWRDVADADSGNVEILQADGSKLAAADGVWLRVTRNAENNELTSEYSMDGADWIFANSRTIEMSETVAYGLIITSHTNDDQIVIAEATDVSLEEAVISSTDNWELFR